VARDQLLLHERYRKGDGVLLPCPACGLNKHVTVGKRSSANHDWRVVSGTCTSVALVYLHYTCANEDCPAIQPVAAGGWGKPSPYHFTSHQQSVVDQLPPLVQEVVCHLCLALVAPAPLCDPCAHMLRALGLILAINDLVWRTQCWCMG